MKKPAPKFAVFEGNAARKIEAMTPAQKQEVATGLDERERRLLKAEKSASLHKGLLLGIVPGIVFGVVLTLISTTSLIDQVGAIWTTRSISERMASP